MRAADCTSNTSLEILGTCPVLRIVPELGEHTAAARRLDWAAIWVEFKVLAALAAPTVVQGAAQQGMLFTDQIFLGHLGTVPLAAAALGNTYNNIMWCAVVIPMDQGIPALEHGIVRAGRAHNQHIQQAPVQYRCVMHVPVPYRYDCPP